MMPIVYTAHLAACLPTLQDSQGNDNADGDYPKLDPHGAAVHLPSNSLVTSDFILPVSTVTANVATYPIGELAPGHHPRPVAPCCAGPAAYAC